MIKIFLSLFYVVFLGFSQTITLKSESWKLAGVSYDTDISTLKLGSYDIVWAYKSGNWRVYSKSRDTGGYELLDSLKGGSGFWIYSMSDENITVNGDKKSEIALEDGWNLHSFTSDISTSTFDTNATISHIWGYRDGKWYLYDKTDNSYSGIEKLTSIKEGEGVWIYALPKSYITVGGTITALKDGNFSKVIKSSSDDVENIWNVSFKVKSSNTQTFNIGIKFKKIATGAVGEVVFQDLKVTDGSISSPSYIIIHGIKSNGDEGETNYNKGDILTNSVSMSNGVVTLNLGYVMKKQTVVSETKFKAVSNYLVQIASSSDVIDNSKAISIGKLTSFSYDFDNSNGIEGYIEIR